MLHIKEHLDFVSFSTLNSAGFYTENFAKFLISLQEDSPKNLHSAKYV